MTRFETEQYLFSNKVKTVGVDFDATLTVIQRDENGRYTNWIDCPPNVIMVDLVRRLITKGKKVYIVTYRQEQFIPEIDLFCHVHDLKVNGVLFTSGESKIPALEKINADCHIDDDISTCLGLFMSNITPILVMDEYNTNNSSSAFINYKL